LLKVNAEEVEQGQLSMVALRWMIHRILSQGILSGMIQVMVPLTCEILSENGSVDAVIRSLSKSMDICGSGNSRSSTLSSLPGGKATGPWGRTMRRIVENDKRYAKVLTQWAKLLSIGYGYVNICYKKYLF